MRTDWQEKLRSTSVFARMKEEEWRTLWSTGKLAGSVLFLVAMFFLGRGAGYVQRQITMASFVPGQRTEEKITEKNPGEADHFLEMTQNWGLGFGAEGSQPSGNTSAAELAKYNAYYVGSKEEQKIYLTFDCGYENGNTGAILDALKKHNVSATFFVVGHYLESAPELVKRMTQEGHTVGNHTYHHPDMSAISDRDAFHKEMEDTANLYQEITGQEMAKYYRPPQGKYNTENLQMAKDEGYATFFWSLAYVDGNVEKQPTHEEAFEKLTTRIHPGAIVLLHNTSRTNGEILDELLTKWEEMGYSFGRLEEVLPQEETKEETKKEEPGFVPDSSPYFFI